MSESATGSEAQAAPAGWDGRIRTSLGILIFFYSFRILGPWFAYGLLYPVALYYQFFARKGIRASNDYLCRRFPGIGGGRLWFMRYRHFLSYGCILVDRAYAFLGLMDKVRIEYRGTHTIRAALEQGKGLILVSAHVGNWELAAYCLGSKSGAELRVPVNAVMYQGEGERTQRQLKRASGEPPFRVISSNDSLQAAIDCRQALQRGEIVAIHGDRVLGAVGVPAMLLGQEAEFAPGPFALAAATGAPVVFTFANRIGPRHYELLADGPHNFSYSDRSQRKQEMQRWVQQYADLLEQRLQEYPLQWHNFYKFWG